MVVAALWGEMAIGSGGSRILRKGGHRLSAHACARKFLPDHTYFP